MARIYVKYDKERTYVTPNGELMTPERVAQEYPGTALMDYVMETDIDGNIMFSMDAVSSLMSIYQLDPALKTTEERIAAISEKMNEPQVFIPDATERLAAAIEYQNMMTYGVVSAKAVEANLLHGLWSADMVATAVTKQAITTEEAKQIASEVAVLNAKANLKV